MAFKKESVDASQIQSPIVLFTERAWSQLELILEHDPMIAGLVLRVAIAGKECDGFTYQVGFTAQNADDLAATLPQHESELKIVMDPFTAYYCQEVSIDFIQDFDLDAEGFVVVNPHQDKYFKKFWPTRPELTPPLIRRPSQNQD